MSQQTAVRGRLVLSRAVALPRLSIQILERSIPAIIADVLSVAVATRLPMLLITMFAFGMVAKQDLPASFGLPRIGNKLLDAAWFWDGGWYGTIARLGYSAESPLAPTTAFWPLFPRLARYLSDLFGGNSLYLMGILVPSAAYLAAMFFLYRLVEDSWGRPLARSTVLIISIFPSTFFLNIAYPTSLLLLAAVASTWLARRSAWGWAALAGYLGALADVSGLLLGLVLVAEYLRQCRSWRDLLRVQVLAPLGPGLGLLTFMAYLQFKLGDAFAFVKASALWGHHLDLPSWTYWDGFGLVLWDPFAHPLVTVNWAVATMFVAAGIWWLARGEYGFGLWTLSLLLLHFTFPPQEPMDGIVRYVLPLFPGFLALAMVTEGRPFLRNLLFCTCLLLLGMFLSQFATNHWIA